MTTQEAAAALWKAVKDNRPATSSLDVVLLLDAERLPWLALHKVVAEFRRTYGGEARQVGFGAIYVVPWHVGLVARLDVPEQV